MKQQILIISIVTTFMCFFIVSCVKESAFTKEESIDNTLEINEAKKWILSRDVKSFSNTQIQANNNSTIKSNLNKSILWNSAKKIKIGNQDLIISKIDDGELRFTGETIGTRRALFYREDGFIKMKVLEFFQDRNSNKVLLERDIEKMAKRVFKKSNDNENFNSSLVCISYNQFYNRENSEKITANKIQGVKNRNSISKKLLSNYSQQSNNNFSNTVTDSDCQLWGMYLDTFDESGQLIESILLFTYYVGNCGNNPTSVDPPDYGGGGVGGGNSNTECSDAQLSYAEAFNQYTSIESGDVSYSSETAAPGPNPNTGRILWTVVENSFGRWRVRAFTDYSYTKNYLYTQITPSGGLVNVIGLNITQFTTSNSFYEGSNNLFESIWTQIGPAQNIIYNNNTSDAYATSRISGTIKHKSKNIFVFPGCNNFSVSLNHESTIPGNMLFFTPR